jgi:glutathione S-transferase
MPVLPLPWSKSESVWLLLLEAGLEWVRVRIEVRHQREREVEG